MRDLLNDPSTLMTLAFVTACALYFTLKLYLARRQMNHIRTHVTAVPSPFDQKISLDDHTKAAQYALTRLHFGRMSLLFSMLVLLFWTLGGGLAGLANLILSVTTHQLHFGILFIVAFSLINSLIDLPMAYVSQFKIEEKFGFNRMTIKLWLMDMLKGALLSGAIGIPLLYGVLWFIKITPSTWWLWAWALFVGLNLLMLWLYPTVIAPLFNKFTALEDGDLKTRLNALLTRCGFSSNGMFVMDGSRRSAHGNAYFTGFGRNKRIVFFDTLLNQLSPPQIEAVLAHELGHFHHKHILKRLAWMLPMGLAIFASLGFLSQQLWFYSGLGVQDSISLLKRLSLQPTHLMAVGLVLFMLVLPVFTFIFAPLTSRGSRRDEFQADAFAVKNSNGQDLIDALVCMYQENASFVGTDPLYSAFYDSHPPAVLRVQRLQQLTASQA
jgi:STE24 endopeptidase